MGKTRPEAYPSYYRAPSIQTREYRLFKKIEKRPLNWYERTVQLAGGFVQITPDAASKERLERSIAFASLRVTPGQVMGAMIVCILLFTVLGIMMLLLGLPFLLGVGMLIAGAPIGYYLYIYPSNLVKTLRIQASSQVVLAVLYMVVSMRISPNMEKALRFAASNITGPLSWDLRRLLWDIELGKYTSADQALDAYIEKWKQENEEFAESLHLIRDSQTQAHDKSRLVLDQALDTILEGTKTRMKHYTQELKMPIMVIHMMGIVLPILGSIMAPMAAVFLSDVVQPWHFVLGYDIVLPIVLVVFINITLAKRPMTFSPVDIRHHPSLPAEGSFRWKGKNIPALPIALIVGFAVMLPAILFFAHDPFIFFKGATQKPTTEELMLSILLVIGPGYAVGIYYLLTTFQRSRLQDEIKGVESEFELALFTLGNRVSGGTPAEVAIEKAMGDMKDLKIRKLFEIILGNIHNLGMTFEQALFDEQYGAVRMYPSKLIRNVMLTVVDTAQKGVMYASESMLRISKYLKNIRETQEYIRDLLEETVSSMKFQAYFLTPIVTGIIVSIAYVIINVLSTLGTYIESLGFSDQFGVQNIGSIFGNTKTSTSPELFQFIIGIYLVEVIMILGMFLTKISYGDNKIIQRNMTGKMLIIALTTYFIVALVSTVGFSGIIEESLSGIGVS